MIKKVISFRCPGEILKSLDELAKAQNVTRSSLITTAVRQLNKEVKRRRGLLLPPIKGKIKIQFCGRALKSTFRNQGI